MPYLMPALILMDSIISYVTYLNQEIKSLRSLKFVENTNNIIIDYNQFKQMITQASSISFLSYVYLIVASCFQQRWYEKSLLLICWLFVICAMQLSEGVWDYVIMLSFALILVLGVHIYYQFDNSERHLFHSIQKEQETQKKWKKIFKDIIPSAIFVSKVSKALSPQDQIPADQEPEIQFFNQKCLEYFSVQTEQQMKEVIREITIPNPDRSLSKEIVTYARNIHHAAHP